jgi:hypothetical protein
MVGVKEIDEALLAIKEHTPAFDPDTDNAAAFVAYWRDAHDTDIHALTNVIASYLVRNREALAGASSAEEVVITVASRFYGVGVEVGRRQARWPDGAPLYVCENCGRLAPIESFQDSCRPGFTHGRLIKVQADG